MKIAIIGYYGHNNLGDELNLHEMMKLIGRQYPLAEITVFSGGLPDLYYQLDYHLILADRMNSAEYREALNRHDLVIIGGGGLVFLGANYFDFLLEGLKVPYIFSRVGIDDRIVAPKACSELKGILGKAYDVTVRTSSDSELAQRHLGLACDVIPEAIWNYSAGSHLFVYAGKKILVSLNAYASEYEQSILEALAGLKTECAVMTLSMQDNATDFYYNIVSTPPSRFILPEAVSLHKKASFLASSDLVITSRLHGGLVAISHGVPAMMINSTKKVYFLLKELNLEHLFYKDLHENDIEALLTNKEKIRSELIEKTNPIKTRAQADIIR